MFEESSIERLRKLERDEKFSSSAVLVVWRSQPDFNEVEARHYPFDRLKNWDELSAAFEKLKRRNRAIFLFSFIVMMVGCAALFIYVLRHIGTEINFQLGLYFSIIFAGVLIFILRLLLILNKEDSYKSDLRWQEQMVRDFFVWLHNLSVLLNRDEGHIRQIREPGELSRLADEAVAAEVRLALILQQVFPQELADLARNIPINPKKVEETASSVIAAKESSLETWRELKNLKLISREYGSYWQAAEHRLKQ